MLILSHPTGNQNMRHAALAFAEVGVLAEAWTCLAWKNDHPLSACLPPSLRAEAQRRSFPPAVDRLLQVRPWRELARLVCRRLHLNSPLRHEYGWCSVDQVYRDLDRCVAERVRELPDLTGVYTYEDGALSTLQAAAQARIRGIYDLPIGYWRAYETICAEEEQTEPAWASTLVGTLDSINKRTRKDDELALATDIVVASTYTRSTLKKYPGTLAPIHVVPYGAPTPNDLPRTWSEQGPLRILFVGGLSQRKGLSYVFRAAQRLAGLATMTVIGARSGNCAALDQALAGYRYIPSLPHNRILEEMRQHDVLMFPSLFEGFGLVITEAMSQGMVVITTPHTCGPDVIDDGVNGFIVPIRDADALTERAVLLADNRERLASMGRAAIVAAGRRTWASFRIALRCTLNVDNKSARRP